MSTVGKRPSALVGLSGTLQALRNFGEYRRVYGWLLRDLLRGYGRRVVLVVALSITGVALQWAVLGGVLVYLSGETGEGGIFHVPLLGGLNLNPTGSVSDLLTFGSAILVFVVAGTVATYAAEAIGFDTARRYVDEGSGRLLASLAVATAPPAGMGEGESPTRHAQRVLLLNQSMVHRALMILQRSMRAVLMATVAVAVLILISPILTLVVAVVGSIFVAPYYLVNRRLVRASLGFEENQVKVRQAVAQLVEQATMRKPNEEVSRALPELYAADAAIGGRWNALREMMLARQRSTAVLSALFGVSMVAIVVTFGSFIADGAASWVSALSFLVALNIASGSFIELGAAMTSANRFVQRVQEYIVYRSSLDQPAAGVARQHHDEPLPPLRAPRPVLPGSAPALWLKPGMRVLCVTTEKVDRLNLAEALGHATDSPETGRWLANEAFFVGDVTAIPAVSPLVLARAAGADPEDLGRRLRDLLSRFGLDDDVEHLPGGLEQPLSPGIERGLSPELRYALVLAGAVLGNARLVVLDFQAYRRLDTSVARQMLEVLEGVEVLFLSFGPVKPARPDEFTHVAVLAPGGVRGLGDVKWFLDGWDLIAGRGARQAGVADDELEDILEE